MNLRRQLASAKRIYNYLSPVFLAIALAIIAQFIISNLDEITALLATSPNLGYLMASFLSACAATAIFAWKIRYFYLMFATELPFRVVFAVYTRSVLLANLPGGIMNHVNLGVELHNHNDRLGLRHTSLLLLLMTAIDILSIVLLIPLAASHWSHWLLSVLFYAAYVVALRLTIGWVFKQFKFPGTLRLKYITNIIVLLGIYWLLWGAAFTFMLLAFQQTIPGFINNIIIYNVAWLAGFLALPMPGGLGIRELALDQLYAWTGAVVTLGAVFSIMFRFLVIVRDLVMVMVATMVNFGVSRNLASHN